MDVVDPNPIFYYKVSTVSKTRKVNFIGLSRGLPND
jgi:hypothetical protein